MGRGKERKEVRDGVRIEDGGTRKGGGRNIDRMEVGWGKGSERNGERG